MTKVMCGKLDCEFLGDGYICQRDEILIECNFNGKEVDYANCSSFQEDQRWTSFVNALQERVEKGEKVI